MNRFIFLLCIEPFSLSFYFSPDYLYSLFLFYFHLITTEVIIEVTHRLEWNPLTEIIICYSFVFLIICYMFFVFLIICYSLVFFLKAEIDLINEIIMSYWSANLFFSLGGKLLTWQLHYKAPQNQDSSPKDRVTQFLRVCRYLIFGFQIWYYLVCVKYCWWMYQMSSDIDIVAKVSSLQIHWPKRMMRRQYQNWIGPA